MDSTLQLFYASLYQWSKITALQKVIKFDYLSWPVGFLGGRHLSRIKLVEVWQEQYGNAGAVFSIVLDFRHECWTGVPLDCNQGVIVQSMQQAQKMFTYVRNYQAFA